MTSKAELLKSTVRYLYHRFSYVKIRINQPMLATGKILVKINPSDQCLFTSGQIYFELEKFLKRSIRVRCSIVPSEFKSKPGTYLKIKSLSKNFDKLSQEHNITWNPTKSVENPTPRDVCTEHFTNPKHPVWLNDQIYKYLTEVCKIVELTLLNPRKYAHKIILSSDLAFQQVAPRKSITQLQGKALNCKLDLISKILLGRYNP